MTCEVIDGPHRPRAISVLTGATPGAGPTARRTHVPEDTASQVQRYIAAWNETEPHARRRAVAALFTEDARYVDPLVDVRGHEGIDATIAEIGRASCRERV